MNADQVRDINLPGWSDVRDHDVEPRTVRQGRVDERAAEVDAAARGLQHPLDQVAHLAVGEVDAGELGTPSRAMNTASGPLIQTSSTPASSK